MTDRVKGFVVTLKRDTREDDARRILEAIEMLDGVGCVESVAANFDDQINRNRVYNDLRRRLMEVFDK